MTADRDAARATDRPADGSATHLSGELRRTVADYEVRIEEAVLRADALRLTGKPADAKRVEGEQHRLVAALEHRLQQQVADALVMREAQRIVAASELDQIGVAPETTAPPAPRESHHPSLVRALAGAIAVVVAAGLLTISNGTVGNLDVTAVRDAIVSVGRSVFPTRQGDLAVREATSDPAQARVDAVGAASSTPTPIASTGTTIAGTSPTTSAPAGTGGVDLADGLLLDLEGAVGDLVAPLPATPTAIPTVSRDRSSDETESESESETDEEQARNPLAPGDADTPSDQPSDDESTGGLPQEPEPAPGETPGSEPTAPEDDPTVLGDESVLQSPSQG